MGRIPTAAYIRNQAEPDKLCKYCFSRGTRTLETLEHTLRCCPETENKRKELISEIENEKIKTYFAGNGHVASLFVPADKSKSEKHWNDVYNIIDPILEIKRHNAKVNCFNGLTKSLGQPLVGCTISYFDKNLKTRFKAKITRFNPQTGAYTFGNSKMLSMLPQARACWRKLFRYHENHNLHIFEPHTKSWIDSWALPDKTPFRVKAREVRDRPPDARLQFK